MNKAILNTLVQDFITKHLKSEKVKLLLKGSPFEDINIQELVEQMETKKKAEHKLPTWFQTKNIYYPSKISMEQTSSEITAAYKSKLVSGKTIADLTGGFGVDSYYFSKKINQVYHFEIDKKLSEIASHNFKALHTNIICENKNGIEAIKNKYFDVIYLDPSRRNASKGKVFYLKDCEPNLVEKLNYLLERTDKLVIKTSPMLDLSVGFKELKKVNEIHIVSVNNEVKELLWIIEKNKETECVIKTINIKNTILEKFTINNKYIPTVTIALPKKYLYEPNAAIMKSGAFDAVSASFKVDKLENNSHLYTSDVLIDFPGRKFLIEKVTPYSKKEMKKTIANSKANITIRNFPESVEALRKKWNIVDGGNNYLFFTTLRQGKKVVLECTKI
ncbi:MAG: SAM-dependent methyltransferase [Bacteroidetes bacterium HGW-Bacteroidetes-2]|nr:MAG: SAM-dependent methyltransferase [Bacteroidetes bacterium HGW-Bacteroidetes-2]